MLRVLLLCWSLAFAASVFADEVAPALPVVISGYDGGCYAKSVPDDYSGSSGRTTVYSVRKGRDRLVETYEWFSRSLYLYCQAKSKSGIAIARVGPWPDGSEATNDQLALAFYMDGELLRDYSTLDIAMRPDNVLTSVSHYRVLQKVHGVFYHWKKGFEYFAVETIDGRRLYFDMESGTAIPASLVEDS